MIKDPPAVVQASGERGYALSSTATGHTNNMYRLGLYADTVGTNDARTRAWAFPLRCLVIE